MPIVSMRQLLDHAAENGYGLPAFNVNNLEQVQRHHGSGRRDRQSGDHAGVRPGARKYAGEAFLRHLIQAAIESYPAHSGRHAPGPRAVARRLHGGHPLRLLERDDGRLAEGGRQDAVADYDYNVDVTRKVVDMAHCDRRHRRRRARRASVRSRR